MTQLVFGNDAIIAAWVASKIPRMTGQTFPHGSKAIGVTRRGAIIAGIVYHNYYPEYKNIEISMAADSPMWATREVITALLRYPFIQLGCRRVTTCTPIRNKRALKFNYGIGFKKEGVIRRGYGNQDMIICGMLRKEAERWLKSEEKI